MNRISLWIYPETLPDGRVTIRIAPRRDGDSPPHDDAQIVVSGITAEEYQQIAETAAHDLAREYGVAYEAVRPSLNILAELHASLRWSKKKRNADLRHHGYDPDGPDGERYRKLFERATLRGWTRGMLEEVPTDVTVIYEPPNEDEYQAAVDAGLIEADMSRREYQSRIAAAEDEITRAGGRVVRLRARARDVIQFMRDHDIPHNSVGRAEAYSLMWLRQSNNRRTP